MKSLLLGPLCFVYRCKPVVSVHVTVLATMEVTLWVRESVTFQLLDYPPLKPVLSKKFLEELTDLSR
jgi:hypothetical protein